MRIPVADLVCLSRGTVLTLLLLIAGPLQAHDLGVARVVLSAPATDVYHLDARLPATLEVASPTVPTGCSGVTLGQRRNDRLTKTLSWRIDCTGAADTAGDAVVLDWQREGALVVFEQPGGTRVSDFVPAVDGIVTLNLDRITGSASDMTGTAQRYIVLGTEHILLGIDHLAFVLALCLIARGWRLVRLVTAFTVGHSLTLALAVLGWVSLPAPPIEASIALSIAFVAREAMLPETSRRHGFWLVAMFGTLHGLGFASALADVGVDPDHRLLGLLAFNLGVELGQLIFVGSILGVGLTLGRVFTSQGAQARTAVAFGLGTVAMLWTFERIGTFVPGL